MTHALTAVASGPDGANYRTERTTDSIVSACHATRRSSGDRGMRVSRRFTFWTRVIRKWPFWWGHRWIQRRRDNEFERVKKTKEREE